MSCLHIERVPQVQAKFLSIPISTFSQFEFGLSENWNACNYAVLARIRQNCIRFEILSLGYFFCIPLLRMKYKRKVGVALFAQNIHAAAYTHELRGTSRQILSWQVCVSLVSFLIFWMIIKKMRWDMPQDLLTSLT